VKKKYVVPTDDGSDVPDVPGISSETMDRFANLSAEQREMQRSMLAVLGKDSGERVVCFNGGTYIWDSMLILV